MCASLRKAPVILVPASCLNICILKKRLKPFERARTRSREIGGFVFDDLNLQLGANPSKFLRRSNVVKEGWKF